VSMSKKEQFPSNKMTNDIALLALVSNFTASCFFLSEENLKDLEPLMVHFGFHEKQREAIVQLIRASMYEED